MLFAGDRNRMGFLQTMDKAMDVEMPEQRYQEMASVTVTPEGRDTMRVWQKNDGDPNVYFAREGHPNQRYGKMSEDAVRKYTGMERQPGASPYPDAANPRNPLSVAAQKVGGYASVDGDHFVDTFPSHYHKRPTGSRNTNEYQRDHAAYMDQKEDNDTVNWMTGTNSYTVPR